MKSKKYINILKRTPNFLEKLSSKRMSRKAKARLWIKGCNFLETIAWRLLDKRGQLRNQGVQLFKWGLKEKEYPRIAPMKLYVFWKLYKGIKK